jgi:hypothetical protein
MATWTVIFEDKTIYKKNGAENETWYEIDDNTFWSQDKFSNLWSIQYQTTPLNHEVEYKDNKLQSTYADADIGDFSQFITKWDLAHLNQLQANWDNNNQQVENTEEVGTFRDETSDEKITRLGARPTSYSTNA